MRKFIIAIIMFEIIGLFGCKKNDTPTNDGDNKSGAPTSIPIISFNGPSSNSSESHLARVKSDISTINTMMGIISPFATLYTPTTQNGNSYTWSMDQGSEVITGTKQSDGSFIWVMMYNGTIGNITFNNYKIWEGITSADKKTGNWKFYSYPQTTNAYQLDYSTDANGVLTGTYQVFFIGTLVANKTVLTNNPDGSGEIDESGANGGGYLLVFKAVWTANGSGTWWTYSSGTENGTGTWQ